MARLTEFHRQHPPSWPFAMWGLDAVGPFCTSPGGYKHILVVVDKFTKWIEVQPRPRSFVSERACSGWFGLDWNEVQMLTKIVVRFARIEIIDGPVPFAPFTTQPGMDPTLNPPERISGRARHARREVPLWRLVLAAPPTPTAAACAKNSLSSPSGCSREPPLPPPRSPAATGG
jgi:hypothetical protein